MRYPKGFRLFILDKILDSVIIIALLLIIYMFYPNIIIFLKVAVSGVLWIYLNKRILLLPLDVIMGPKEEILSFRDRRPGGNLYILQKYSCDDWALQYKGEPRKSILVTNMRPREEFDQLEHPEKNQKLIVRYYRFSKILYDWKPAE